MDSSLIGNQTIISDPNSVAANPRLQRPGQGTCFLVQIYPAGSGDGLVPLLLNRPFVIGREKTCDLVLADSTVSRQHAKLEARSPEVVMLSDMGSTNGTFVQDELVSQRFLLAGDLIRIGKYILKFLSSDHIETQYHETIYSMMIQDGLTGVYNYRYFAEAAERELVRSYRHQRPLSLIMLDIDRFKSINDTHGHLAGDAVLRELCNRIRPIIGVDEVLARYGGEEFAILLPEARRERAITFAEQIREFIASEPISICDVPLSITVSLGIACVDGTERLTLKELIRRADDRLLEAKRTGRNRVVVAD